MLHTVGPVWRDGAHDEPALLANCYWRSLRLAEQMGRHSVAFPAISCGMYGYPLHQAARIAVAETTAWQRAHAVPKRVILVAYGDAAYKAYQAAAAATPSGVSAHLAAERIVYDCCIGACHRFPSAGSGAMTESWAWRVP